MRLSITALSSSTVTRTKANEAYRNLTHYIAKHERLVIILEGPISFSFLDQLICRLRDSQVLHKITFLIGLETSYERLVEIATAQKVSIHYQTHAGDHPKLIERSAARTRSI
jgi:hypothetical protein